MHSQIVFEDLTTLAKRVEEFASALAVAIILSQIAKRLLAFENRGRSTLSSISAIRCYVSEIATFRQPNFERTGGITLCLRPQKSQPLQPQMGRCFGPLLD